MITMIHAVSGRKMELADSEAVKRRILERCGWAELVDIPEEELQPNDARSNLATNGGTAAQPKAKPELSPIPKPRKPTRAELN